MKRWTARVLTGLWILFGALAAMVGAAWMPAGDALGAVYPDRMAATEDVQASVAAAPRPEHDPDLPTAVVVVGSHGANAADVLAPYEVLAVSGAFNVYIAGPERRPVPLTGGLDVVPDYSFAELERLLPAGVDVAIAPEVPDAKEPSSEPVRDWLVTQASAGATVMGVCTGAELLAGAGLLDGQEATSHWLALGLGSLDADYPRVRWTTGVRYVDNGKIITTAGVLSGIDGALRVLERREGKAVARDAAEAVGWSHYRPGRSGSVPGSRVEPTDVVALLSMGYREPTQMGVLLTGGVGEIELASTFRPYTALSYLAHPRTVTADGGPIRSRHGLTFVPRFTLTELAGGDLDRLVVPGLPAARAADPAATKAASAVGLEAEYPHAKGEFAFDGVLRDIAATADVATARWVAKTLEYPVGTELDGAAWPWALLVRALGLGLAGAAIAAAVAWLLYRRTAVRHFVRHAVEMVLAMLAGMMLLDMVWKGFWPALSEWPAVDTLVMAIDMTVGMALWMWIRGHGGRLIAEMGVAMVAPFVVLLVPYALDRLSADGLMLIGHVGMVLAMIGAMLLRLRHYTHPHGRPSLRRRASRPRGPEPESAAPPNEDQNERHPAQA